MCIFFKGLIIMIMRYLGIFIVILALGFGAFWFTLNPSINPDDIELTGNLINAKELENHIFNEFNYALTIKLDNKTGKKLIDGDRNQYFSDIYVYIDDHIILETMDSYELEKFGFIAGKHGYTSIPAKEKLSEYGVTIPQNMSVPSLYGLMYIDTVFPVEIQYYITNIKYQYPNHEQVAINQKPNLDNAYIVYSHYEKRWGKDLSWVKVFKINDKTNE